MPVKANFQGFVGEELTVDRVSEFLDSLNGEDIEINLYTPGGMVYEGIEIYNRIKMYKGKKTVIVGGMVASIGMYILAAFDEIQAQDSSAIYLHNVQSIVIGDYKAMRKEADDIERLNRHVAEVWARRSGKSVEQIIEYMENETWFYGSEILNNGFADKLIETGNNESRENALPVIQAKFKNENEQFRKRVAHFNNVDNDPQLGISKNNGETIMDKQELLKKLNVLRQNGDITLSEIAESLGLSDQLITPEAKNALEIVNKMNKAGVKDIEKEFKTLTDRANKADDMRRENELLKTYGPRKFDDGTVNVVREYAEQLYKGDVTLDQINESEIMKRLKAQNADYTSPANTIEVVEGKGKKQESGDTEIVKY